MSIRIRILGILSLAAFLAAVPLRAQTTTTEP